MIEGVAVQPDTFYFGAAGGGVWATHDAGRTWSSVFDGGPAASVGAIAVAPSDPRVIYIGEGQPEARYDVAAGRGVFKSIDAGKTWRSVGLSGTRHIGRIWIDPANADNVLVAAVGDFFAPGDQRGVFRSTDGGLTWSHALNIAPDTGAVDLTADPNDPRTVFAAAWQARQYPWQSYFTPIVGPRSGLYRSADGGRRWTRISGGGWPLGDLGRISLAATRKGGSLRLYAVISAGEASGLYRSDDGARSWRRVNAELGFAGYYASRVTVFPDDPDEVFLVGQSIRRCEQGGTTCEIIKGAPGGDDYHQVWINSNHPDHIAAASDQGAVISVNGGRTWSSWYNQPTGQFYHLAANEGFPYRIYAGQQDSGTVEIASRGDYGAIGEREWRSVGGDERDYEIPDPNHPEIVYGSGLGGRVTRFDSRTGEVTNITPFPIPNYGKRQTTTEHRFTWVTPLALSRAGPKTLYLGGEVVFASTDEGAHWSTISPDLTGKREAAKGCDGEVRIEDARACGYGGIWTLAPSPRHAEELWVGTDDGLVQLTRDGGKHWSEVAPPRVSPWAKVSSIDLSPARDGTAYVAIDGHRLGDVAPHLWKTSDYGATWRIVAGDLPKDHFVSVVRADPLRDGLLYAGTDVGAYVSFDDGLRWRALGHGLPTAWVRDLLLHGDDLLAATQGRALWIVGDLGVLRQAAATAPPRGPHLFSPAPAMRLRGNNNHGDTPPPPDEPLGRNPPTGAVVDYWLASPAKGPISIEIRDSSGHLVRRFSSEPHAQPAAKVYFASRWLDVPAPLSRAAGFQQVVWDLRSTPPSAIRYAYSIATVPGADTPLAPQGVLSPPGRYQVILDVDGRRVIKPLVITADPRAPLSLPAMEASLALSRSVGESLRLARLGYGEEQAARSQLTSILARVGKARADHGLARRVSDLADRLARPAVAPTFVDLSDILTGIETDLEGTDLAPTQAQTAAAAYAGDRVRALWATWISLRDGDLADLNVELRDLGREPVTFPLPEELIVSPPEGGEEAP
ncbi:MAG TPA: hypothetical protein VII63_13455 [Caulobacteraceae bacterium]